MSITKPPYLLVLLVILIIAVVSTASFDSLVIKEVERIIHIDRNYEIEIADITLVNQSDQPIDQFIYIVPPSRANSIALIECQDASNTFLSARRFHPSFLRYVQFPKDAVYYEITLQQAVLPAQSTLLTVAMSYSNTFTPLPAAIHQNESQRMFYQGELYFYSLYHVQQQQTVIRTYNNNIISYTPRKFMEKKDNILSIDSFTNIPPLTQHHLPLTVHSENHSMFANMRVAIREIELSHWGNISTTEYYEMEHNGAKLKGPWHRSTYDQTQNKKSGLISFYMKLPLSVHDIVFRDAIGNISTSIVYKEQDHRQTIMQFAPRYPLYGGWSCDLEIGYQYPLTDMVTEIDTEISTKPIITSHNQHHTHESMTYYQDPSHNRHNYQLTIPFGVPIKDILANDVIVRIIFPETTSNIQYFAPFEIDHVHTYQKRTYLDIEGRPVLELRKQHIVSPLQDQQIIIRYYFNPLMLFREYGMIFAVIFTLLMLILVIFRIDLSLHHPSSNIHRVESDHHDDQASLPQKNSGDVNEKTHNVITEQPEKTKTPANELSSSEVIPTASTNQEQRQPSQRQGGKKKR